MKVSLNLWVRSGMGWGRAKKAAQHRRSIPRRTRVRAWGHCLWHQLRPFAIIASICADSPVAGDISGTIETVTATVHIGRGIFRPFDQNMRRFSELWRIKRHETRTEVAHLRRYSAIKRGLTAIDRG